VTQHQRFRLRLWLTAVLTLPCHLDRIDSYKNRLEDILNDIILISEIAELSLEAETIANVIGIKNEGNSPERPNEINATADANTPRMSRMRQSSVTFDEDSSSKSKSMSGMKDDDADEGSVPSQLDSDDADGDSTAKGTFYESSSRLPIKDLLDRWEEPLSKRDQVCSASSLNITSSSVFLGH
jgi:hypothetical protein